MGTTQAPAQGFLNKLKNKGAKLVKQAMPNPVKDVVKTVEDTEGAASRTRTRVENKVRNKAGGESMRRTRTQAGSSMDDKTLPRSGPVDMARTQKRAFATASCLLQARQLVQVAPLHTRHGQRQPRG